MSTTSIVVALSEFLGVVVPMGMEGKIREYRRGFSGLEKLAFDIQKLLVSDDFEHKPFISADQLPEGKSVIYFMKDDEDELNCPLFIMAENKSFYLPLTDKFIDVDEHLKKMGEAWIPYWSDHLLGRGHVPLVGDVYVYHTMQKLSTVSYIVKEVTSDVLSYDYCILRDDGTSLIYSKNESIDYFHRSINFSSFIMLQRGSKS